MSLGCERILAFGRDGTFRAVAEALLGIDVRLGLVATGTNNDIARALGLPSDPHEVTEIALTGHSEWISAGRINGYYFLEGAGIGLEAELWPVGEAVVVAALPGGPRGAFGAGTHHAGRGRDRA